MNRSRRFWLWGVVVCYTGLIYATLSIVGQLRKFLVEKIGLRLFKRGETIYDAVYVLLALLGVYLIWYLWKSPSHRKVSNFISLLLIALIYWYFLQKIRFPVEKVHFLEYGLLSWFVFEALFLDIKDWRCYGWTLLIVYAISLGDETLQALLPNRVGEINDVLTNFYSALLGLALVGFILHPAIDFKKNVWSAEFGYGIMGLAVCTAIFIERVHGFGYRHWDRNIGVFRSSFTRTDLKTINEKLSQGSVVQVHQKKEYENEALRHLFQREYYLHNKFYYSMIDYHLYVDKSYNENELIEKYYPVFLKNQQNQPLKDWIQKIDPDLSQELIHSDWIWTQSFKDSLKAMFTSETVWESRVKGNLITQYKIQDLWFWTVLIIIFSFYLNRKIHDPADLS